MAKTQGQSPATRRQVIDLYFLEHRAKLLDVAAFLDRIDRSVGDDDFRVESFRRAMDVLRSAEPDRVRRILELLSDPTDTPIDRAHAKGAAGAYDPRASARG